jgi:UDP-2,3-diacylglucosamine pyrophosphatase LpxH
MLRTPIPVYRHKTVFISDLHLGSDVASAKYLYEFLSHLDCQDIYLVGDIFDGWEMQGRRKPKAFDEMQRRVVDVLNAMAARGVRVHYIPGNHDEKLRPRLAALQNRKSHKIFHENISFAHHETYETEGPNKKRLRVAHGDEHDPDMFVKWWFRPVVYTASKSYDLGVRLSYDFSNWLYEKRGVHFSPAGAMKSGLKWVIGRVFSSDSLLKGLKNGEDGILYGHTHTPLKNIVPGKKKFPRDTLIVNDGDWVESCTFAATDEQGELQVYDYRSLRKEKGFGDLPDESRSHPEDFSRMRPVTDRQIRMAYKLWPARRRLEYLQEVRERGEKLQKHLRLRGKVGTLIRDFDGAACGLESEVWRKIEKVLKSELTRNGIDSRRQIRLTGIFNTCAQGNDLCGEDRDFVSRALEDIAFRLDRKIEKQRDEIAKISRRLDSPIRQRNWEAASDSAEHAPNVP